MARKKKEKRIHINVSDKVASIYIQERYVPKCEQVFTDGYDTIDTCYYENIAVCVGNSRRENNNWWNGDKLGEKKHNKSTGNSFTFMAIAKALENHIVDFINQYDYYCCMFYPTDKHRKKAYLKMIEHFCKKYNKDFTYVITDFVDDMPEYLIYIE